MWKNKMHPSPNRTDVYTDGALMNESLGEGIFCDSLNAEVSTALSKIRN